MKKDEIQENNFFPSNDYKVPETSNYMKLTEGSHTFRVLSSAIVGYEYFKSDNKPVRSRDIFDEIPDDMKKDGRISHFWAFVVYNYEAKRVQILEITQKTIMTPLKALIDNPKWGSPFSYDITITRKGTTKQDTEYTIMPNPSEPLSEEVQNAYIGGPKIDLEKLYKNEDPFTGK